MNFHAASLFGDLALDEAGLPYDPALDLACPIDAECARERAVQLLTLPVPASAIVAVTDVMALGVISAARDRGARVPDDVSVVGMDDTELASIVRPPLTTVRIRKDDMGRMAAQLLLDLIRGRHVDPGPVVCSNELVVRGTMGGGNDVASK